MKACALLSTCLALALVGCGGSVAAGGSTLRATWADSDGNGVLERSGGEPLMDRTELAPASAPTRTLASFAQFTDAHVRDAESPARVPFLDRYGPPFTSAFRPQEALSARVLAAVVESIDAMRPQAVVETGDMIDNDQANELATALAVLRGGRVEPASGSRRYEGVQEASNPDPFYYRPDVDAPRHPGLLAAAQRPFTSPGLKAPWYPIVGNHDLLVQGVLAATPETQAIATGGRALWRLRPGTRFPRSEARLGAAVVDRLLQSGLPGDWRRVTPDPLRRELRASEVLDHLRAASGHGGGGPLLDYSFDVGPSLRGVALDLVHRRVGAEGTVRRSQVGWLRAQLRAAGQRWVVVFSHQPLTSATGGQRILALLDRDPRVVAAIAGDSHHNRARPRRSPAGGYWLVQTSSLADYPQQARAFRLIATANGGVALETWMLDASPTDPLARTARQLAYLDPQGGRPGGDIGGRLDRNVRLYKSRPGVRVARSPGY